MANHKSAKKRSRQNVVRNERNTVKRSMTKTALKKVRTAIEAKNKDEAVQLLPTVQKLLDRLAKTGIIKKNTAARTNSRLASQVNSL